MYDFGPLAAENDPNILSYFHTTRQVSGLVTAGTVPANFIFVARPGGGKTALVKWLESGRQSRTMVFIRPTETRLIMEEDEPNAADYRILMSAELFTGIVSEAQGEDTLSGELRGDCDKYLRETWWKALGRLLSERFEGIQILGSGFSLKAEDRRAYLREIRKDRKVERASALVKRIASEVDLTLVVDNPEFIVGKGLEDVTLENAIRIGAFLSVLNQLHSLGIQVIAFAKEHVLQNVQRHYRDSSHFEDRVEGLEWTEDDLLNMLRLRIEKRLKMKWKDVFTIGEKTFRQLVFPCLINGPRDLLFICNTAGRGDKRISKATLEKSIDAIRARKWVDIATQYGGQWPKVNALARRICDIIAEKFRGKPLSREQFRSAIEDEFSRPRTPLHDLRTQEEWINTALWASPSIEERLFVVGCLGYVYGAQRFYPWAGRSLEKFRLADSLFISPLFA